MCGINGLIYFKRVSKKKLANKIRVMQNMTHHRGPDQDEVLIFDQAAIGMNRLAIVAPNEKSMIQSIKINNKYSVFNGEIVNYKKLRTLLKKSVGQQSDSAIILPLFEKFGQDFVKKLAGMFAIAIYDQPNHTLKLFRDPLGIKPLYYFHSDECVIFSSEIKAIYAVMDKAPEVDFAAIDHILRYRFQPGRSTVFSNIKRVLPGETIYFAKNKMIKKRYWKLSNNNKYLKTNFTINKFRNLLTRVIKENAQADVQGGFFTSGGLDSSLITSLSLKVLSSPYKQPISLKFLPESVTDQTYGELLEKYLKTKFEWVTITDSLARETLVNLIPFLDEPLENPIHIGTFLMAKRAHQLGIKSIMTGDGSDEFFLGYERHACWFNSSDPIKNYPKLGWTMTPEEADELYKKTAKSSIKPIINGFNKLIESIKTMDQALMFERSERLVEYHNMRLDRMTMAHGVEAKVPFLDHRIVEYSLQIPHKILFGKDRKDWLKAVSLPYLPESILNRPKVLFPSLPDQWLSGKGTDWASRILLKKNNYIQKWIKLDVLRKYINEQKKNIRSHGRLLWALIVLELWQKNLPSWRSQTE